MKRDDAGNNLISLVKGNERQAFHKALLTIETVQMEIPGLPQTRKNYFQGLPIELTEERLSNFKNCLRSIQAIQHSYSAITWDV